MSELSFLIDLLLNHKLPKKTKDLIKDRITLIEERRVVQQQQPGFSPVRNNNQAPSMQAKIEAMEQDVQHQPIQPAPVSHLATQALMDRQRLINKAVNSGPFGAQPEPGLTAPKKF